MFIGMKLQRMGEYIKKQEKRIKELEAKLASMLCAECGKNMLECECDEESE